MANASVQRAPSTFLAKMMNFMFKNDELSVKNDEHSVKNDELSVKNDEHILLKIMKFSFQNDGNTPFCRTAHRISSADSSSEPFSPISFTKTTPPFILSFIYTYHDVIIILLFIYNIYDLYTKSIENRPFRNAKSSILSKPHHV